MEGLPVRAGVAVALFFGFLVLGSCANESTTEHPANGPVWPEPPVKLLILGTFHFTDAGLDSYRPDPSMTSTFFRQNGYSKLRNSWTFRQRSVPTRLPWSGSEYPGVDSRTAWYNRNLRIFVNLRRLSDMQGDRVLLIIGHGHLPVLRHAAEASPQFDLVEVADVL